MSTFVLQLVLALCLLSGHAWARAPSASNAQYYDKQVNVFNSEGDLPQLAYADIAASRGESLVCLCTDDGGVVLCTPTWSGAPLLDRRVIDKIAKVDDGGIWVAFAGLAGDGRSLVRIARRICASHRLQFNAPPTLRYLTKSIADIQHDATLSGSERPFGANLIVMGYDQGAETPQVLLSRASGSISQWRAAAIGKNAVKALAHLEAKLVASTAEKLVRRPATAIEAAALALDLFRQHDMSSSFASRLDDQDQDQKDQQKPSPANSNQQPVRKCDLYRLSRSAEGVPKLTMAAAVSSADELGADWVAAKETPPSEDKDKDIIEVVPSLKGGFVSPKDKDIIEVVSSLKGGFVSPSLALDTRRISSSPRLALSAAPSDSVADPDVEAGGRVRRALRAVAQRLKAQAGALATITSGATDATGALSADGFMKNLDTQLSARGLVLLRFHNVEKKKACKDIATALLVSLPGRKSQIVQIVGHTVLLFRPGSTETDSLLSKEMSAL